MESSCTFSFEDLFWAAHGRAWTRIERDALLGATQDRRNELVRAWARGAGGVRLEDRTGDDGTVYAAFQFERPRWWERLAWRTPRPAEAVVGDDPATPASPLATAPADAAPDPSVPLAPSVIEDPTGPWLVGAVTRTGGPLVPGKGVLVTRAATGAELQARVRAALRGIDGSMLHVAEADETAPDLAVWLADHLRCRCL